MNTICLFIDQLQSAALSAYGNTWFETPAIDRLAAEAFLCEQAMATSDSIPTALGAYLHGRRSADAVGESLARLLDRAGRDTIFLSDRADWVDGADDFDRSLSLLSIADNETPAAPAESLADSHVGRCFATLIDQLEACRSDGSPFFLFSLVGSLGTCWDAPSAQYLLDEDDPPSYSETAPPRLELAAGFDPDELLPIATAYAAQVMAVDACLGVLLDHLDQWEAEQPETAPVLVLGSPRGYRLGEHRLVGPSSSKEDDLPYSETIHVPLMIRRPDRCGATTRTQSLVEPCDLYATLGQWCGVETPPTTGRDLTPLMELEPTEWRDAIRTHEWYYIEPTDERRPVLYAKPDDRFEVNDVANRCRSEMEELEERMEKLQQE